MKSKRTALQEAVRLLALRARSQKEIQEHLRRRQYPSEEIEETLDQLNQKRLLNDEELCQRLFEKLATQGGYGLEYIRHKLLARGLDPQWAADEIAYWKESGREQEEACGLLRKKYAADCQAGDCAKIARVLSNRGFSPSIIQQALELCAGK